MSAFDYKLSTITKYRAGTQDDPYIPISESKKIVNQQILLSEIPVIANRVTITGFTEVQTVPSTGLTGTGFNVDYNEGIVTFAPGQEGVTVSPSYRGRGNHYVSSARVWTVQQNGDITQTLSDVVSAASNFVWLDEFSNSTVYNTYNLVNYEGSTFMYISVSPSSGHLPTNGTYWAKISGMTVKGVWSSSTTYASGDIVEDGTYHNIYQSLVGNNLNNALTDSTKWKVLISVQTAIDTLNTTNTNVTSAESGRVSAESGRVSAESGRVSAESGRSSAETARAGSETTRSGNESTRISQESTRQSGYTAFKLLEPYDNTHSYVPMNKVTLSGSSYQCILATTGNTPPNATYWVQIAAAGSVASVTSVNSDISVANPTSSPVLTANTGVGANQLAKRDANGNIQNIGYATTNVSANTTLTLAQSGIINVTTGATDKTITLPDATTAQVVFTIKKVDSGAGHVVINTTASQIIDGSATKTLINQFSVITVVSSGSQWWVDVDNDTDKIGLLTDDLNNATKTPINLGYGTQVVTVPRDTPYNVLNFMGQTLINRLGRIGNCEGSWPMSINASLDTSVLASGVSSMHITGTSVSAYVAADLNGFDTTKTYLLAVKVKANSANSVISFWDYGAFTNQVVKANLNTAFSTFTLVWFKFTGISQFRVSFGHHQSAGTDIWIDEARIYQLSPADIVAVDSMTLAQIDSKFPYVDDMKTVNAFYITKRGENLHQEFIKGTVHAKAVVNEQYKLTHTSADTTTQDSTFVSPAIGGQAYTFSRVGNDAKVILQELDANGNVANVNNGNPVAGGFTWVTAATTTKINQIFRVDAIGTFVYENPILNLGATPLATFKPRVDQSIYTTTNLLASSNVDRSIADKVESVGNGKLRITRQLKTMDLDGSLSYSYSSDFVGSKSVYVSIPGAISDTTVVPSRQQVVKYDGKILRNDGTNVSDEGHLYSADLYIIIPDIDSGWGETYQPTPAEIQAYFYGWRMYDGSNANNVAYENTLCNGANKAWGIRDTTSNTYRSASLGYGISNGTSNLPTTLAPVGGNFRWSNYRLQYQLAQSVDEFVEIEGSIALHEGANQIEVGTGVVVREWANPQLAGGYAQIGAVSLPSSLTKNRILKILALYKNREVVQWEVISDGVASGKERIRTIYGNFDSSAAYEITYLALDTYTLGIAPRSISGEYTPNLRETVDELAKRSADVIHRVSVLERSTPNKALPQFTDVPLLSGWVNYGGSYQNIGYRMVGSRVDLRGVTKSGTISPSGVTMFYLPRSVAPKQLSRELKCFSTNGTSTLLTEIILGPDGSFRIYGGGNTYLSLDDVFYWID